MVRFGSVTIGFGWDLLIFTCAVIFKFVMRKVGKWTKKTSRQDIPTRTGILDLFRPMRAYISARRTSE